MRRAPTSTAVGDLVSWSVEEESGPAPYPEGTADEEHQHTVLDRGGVEWVVREVKTPQVWARGHHCLVLNSRECVRRLWNFPENWRELDADTLLRLGEYH